LRLFIDSYNPRSVSARRLADAIGARIIRHEGSRYRPRPKDVVVHWGKSEWNKSLEYAIAYNADIPVLNLPEAVAVAQDKLKTFTELNASGVSVPEFTTDLAIAQSWAEAGLLIVSRALLRASGGRGMMVDAVPQTEVDGHPVKLWVRYRRKSREWRVHVFNGEVIDVQQKKRSFDAPDADRQIRNYNSGWVFAREGIETQPEIELIKAEAVKAVAALGLDFGGVDIIYSAKKNKVWVLEVNTAPGLEGQTVESYGNAIKRYTERFTSGDAVAGSTDSNA